MNNFGKTPASKLLDKFVKFTLGLSKLTEAEYSDHTLKNKKPPLQRSTSNQRNTSGNALKTPGTSGDSLKSGHGLDVFKSGRPSQSAANAGQIAENLAQMVDGNRSVLVQVEEGHQKEGRARSVACGPRMFPEISLGCPTKPRLCSRMFLPRSHRVPSGIILSRIRFFFKVLGLFWVFRV
jgi:hypothetical protein